MRSMLRNLIFPTLVALPAVARADFITHIAASELRFGYQVLIADINNDDRPDLVGLGAQMNELVWFENPTWDRHVLAAEVSGMINVDAADIDGDGIPEIALAYGFSTIPSRSSGEIAILSHGADPDEPWTLAGLDAVPTTHRVRWATVDDSGEPVLIAAPILNEQAQNQSDPERLPTPLLLYRPGDWKRELITDRNLGAMHGILPLDSDGDGSQEILTAGRLGLHSHRLDSGGNWVRTQLSDGVDAPYPDGGSSDVSAGQINGSLFFAAIEPFHGNEVVVYRQSGDGLLTRNIIDTELANGHTITIADLTGDGNGEIVAAGNRGRSVYLYRAVDAAGERWERSVIDDDISANSCAAEDINGDGRIDIACIDMRAPNNLKWYENTGSW